MMRLADFHMCLQTQNAFAHICSVSYLPITKHVFLGLCTALLLLDTLARVDVIRPFTDLFGTFHHRGGSPGSSEAIVQCRLMFLETIYDYQMTFVGNFFSRPRRTSANSHRHR